MCLVHFTDDIQWIIETIQNLYRVHIKSKSPDRIEYFNKFALFTEILFLAMIIMYATVVVAFLLFPVFIYATTNEIILVVRICVS